MKRLFVIIYILYAQQTAAKNKALNVSVENDRPLWDVLTIAREYWALTDQNIDMKKKKKTTRMKLIESDEHHSHEQKAIGAKLEMKISMKIPHILWLASFFRDKFAYWLFD